MAVRLDRLRRIALPLSLLAGAAGLLVFLASRIPLSAWLVWTYAAFMLAAAVFVLGCASIGHAALRLLAVRVPFRERLVLDVAVGVLLFAVGIFLAGLLGLLGSPLFFAYPAVLLALGGPWFFADMRRAWRHFAAARRRARLSPSLVHGAALVLGTVGFAIVYLTILVPENASFDAQTYHLPIAEHYAAWGRVGRFPEGWYAGALPHLASWLYTWPFCLRAVNLFGQVVLAAHLELALFAVTVLSTPVLVEAICPGRRARGAWAVFFLFPGLFLYDSSLGLAADHVLAFWAVPLALAVRRLVGRPFCAGRAALVGLLMAGAALTKYQAMYLLVPATLVLIVGFVRALYRRAPAGRGRLLLAGPGTLALTALVASAPHWLANVIWHGNPVYPLLGKLFPSRPWVPGWAGPTLDSGWQPTGTLLEKLVETAGAVFTFAFIPHDWAPFHRDLPVFGFLFTLTLPVLLLAPGAWRARLLGAGTLLALGIWYWTYHQDRYLQALLPWMVACTAAAMMLAWRAGRVARVGLVLLVGLQIVWGGDVPWYPTHAMMHDVPAMRALRLLSSTFRGDWRDRFRFDTGFKDVDRALPRDAFVLLHEEYLRLGLNRRAMADSARWQGAIDYPMLARPDRVHDRLASLGVSHLVWSRSHSVNREIPVSGELVFFGYALRFGEILHDAGRFAVASLPSARPPPLEPGPVAYFGCKGAGLVPLSEVDAVVVSEGEGHLEGVEPAALESAEFAVVDQRCRASISPTLAAAFLQAPSWGDLQLWIRRR